MSVTTCNMSKNSQNSQTLDAEFDGDEIAENLNVVNSNNNGKVKAKTSGKGLKQRATEIEEANESYSDVASPSKIGMKGQSKNTKGE